jgi:hemoglobin
MTHRRIEDLELPLGSGGRDGATGGPVDEPMIRRLVDTFYDRVVADAVLGPVFRARVADWPVHLARMYDFWSAVVLQTGRYAGRPLERHRAIDELEPAHFARWVALWSETVRDVAPPGVRDRFTIPAGRMALTMSARLFN